MRTNGMIFGLLGIVFGCSSSDDLLGVVPASDVVDAAGGSDDLGTDTLDATTTADDTPTADDTGGAGLPETTEDIAAPDIKEPWKPATYVYPPCDPKTPVGLAGCVDPVRLKETLTKVSGSRAPGEAHWQETRELCRTTLEALGFTVDVQRAFLGGNVIGTRLGTELPAEKVIVGVRMDGPEGCVAADGNASGVAAALEIARVLRETDHRRTLVVACWDLGEFGRAGSEEHADDLAVGGDDVVVVFDLEGLGYTNDAPDSQTVPITAAQFGEAKATLTALEYRGVTLAFTGTENVPGPLDALEATATSVGLPFVTFDLKMDWLTNDTFSDFRRSDHAAFWDRGLPAIWVSDTGSQRNPSFRCRQGSKDDLETIDWEFHRAATATTAGAVATTLDAADPGTTPGTEPPLSECNLKLQDCAAVGQRCVYRRDAEGAEKRACVAVSEAPKAAGEACVRPADILGEDDCGVGLFCSFFGGEWKNADPTAPEYVRVCSPYCRFTKDCAAGELCVGIGSSDLERTGLCRPGCAVFQGTCPAGQKCLPSALTHGFAQAPVCMPAGPVDEDEPCTDASGCAGDLTCLPVGDGSTAACRPICDSEHSCAETQNCFAPRGIIGNLDPLQGGSTDFGYCYDQFDNN